MSARLTPSPERATRAERCRRAAARTTRACPARRRARRTAWGQERGRNQQKGRRGGLAAMGERDERDEARLGEEGMDEEAMDEEGEPEVPARRSRRMVLLARE